MSEAGWRKRHDQNFGKSLVDGRWSNKGTPLDWVPPLHPGERGLVLSAPIDVELGITLGPIIGGISRTRIERIATLRGPFGDEIGGLHPQELRFALLFWERIAWPWSPVFAFSGPDHRTPEIDVLVVEGVVGRPRFLPSSGGPIETASYIVDTQYNALTLLEQRDPHCWSLALGQNSLAIDDQEDAEGPCVAMKLHRAIAVPTADAAIDDVLEFRLRRRPELLSIRSAVEEAAIKVCNDVDQIRSLHRELEKLDAACADQVRVAKEQRLPLRIGSMHTLVAASAGAYAGVAEFANNLMELPAATSQMLGGVAAATTLGIEVHRTMKALALERKTPYDYVGQYHEELFRP